MITPEMRFVAARENREPEFVRVGNRPRPGDPAGQHQPSRERADDHRPQLPREGQRQHRQLGRPLVDRRRSGEAAMGHPLGRRHGDGPLHRREHPRHAGVDRAELARADRHRADLPGLGEGQRQGRGLEFRRLLPDAPGTGRAGRRLLHDPRRRALALYPADRAAGDGHRLPRRLDPGQVVPHAPCRELSLHPLPRAVRIDGPLRRGRLAGRRAAARLDCRRQRRRPVRRTGHAWAS